MTNSTMYREFKIPKGIKVKITNNGRRIVIRRKPRQICAPVESLKKLQREILDNELSKVKCHKCAYGFVKGKTIWDNAKVHVGSGAVLNIDLKDFFPTITKEQVEKALVANGFDKEKAAYIADVCTYKGVLPQGAPTSPMLSNIVAKPMDKKIYTLCKKRGLKYTRYADDITISGDSVEGLLEVKPKIFSIISSFGWKVSGSKVKIVSRNNPSKRMEVTGLTVNVCVNPPRKDVRKFRNLLYRIERKVESGEIRNREDLARQFQPLEAIIGYSNFLYQINPNNKQYFDRARHLAELLK